MSGQSRCVLMVGGSPSIHVRAPAQMIRAAGYRTVLADVHDKPAPEAATAFDAVHSLRDPVQRLISRCHGALVPSSVSNAPERTGEILDEIVIERPTRRLSYAWMLMQGMLQARRLARIIWEEHPGVVHFQSMTICAMMAYSLLKRLGWPRAHARPGLLAHLWGYGARYPGFRRRETLVLKQFDHIHTSSPAVARIYREYFEVPAERLSVFVRGINLDTFAPREPRVLDAARAAWGIPANKFVILHNRHMHMLYHVDVAIDAFAVLVREGHDVALVLVRGGMRNEEYERAMMARAAAAGVGDRVVLLPPVLTPDEMATALQLSHCSINCVTFDAFPVSLLEAMYCRSVPVVRNLESYTQFVKDGQTAFAVDGTVESYVQRIRSLIQDPGLRDRLADAGVALVQLEGTQEIFRSRTLELVERCWHEW